MRSLILGSVLLMAGVAGASAQPWPGYGPGYGPPPPPVYGPPRGYGYGGYGPRPEYGVYGPPRRRCWIRPGFYGPERVCRW